MYYSRQELVKKYEELLKESSRRVELERIRVETEVAELCRKAKISRLVDTQGRYPWEEGYE